MAGGKRPWGSLRQLRSGRWQAKYLSPDTHLLTPAPSTFRSKADGDRWLSNKRAALDRAEAGDDQAAQLPLRHWWPAYEASLAGLKPSTRANYSAAWRLRIEPRFGSTPVRRIKPSHVDEWQQAMTASGVSASKVIETCGVLKRLMDAPVRDRVISVNPVALRGTSLPRRPQTHRPVLSPADVGRLVTATKREDDKLIVRLLAYGGLRIGEVLALRTIDHDPVGHTLSIRQSVGESGGHLVVGPTKTYAERTITLPASLSQELSEFVLAQRDFSRGARHIRLVFPNRRGDHRRYRVWRRDSWDPAIKTAKLEATPHDLRATCASLLIDAGASVKDVQHHLGHRDITTTLNLYARVRPGRSADLAAKMDLLLSEI